MNVKLIATLLVLALAVLLGAWLSSSWWVPQLDATITKLLQTQDQASSAEHALAGANATLVATQATDQKIDQIKTGTNHVTASIRASASASTIIPRADAHRLWAADVELCKLGLVCSSETGDGVTQRVATAPAPTPVQHATNVPIIRTSDRGNTDLR